MCEIRVYEKDSRQHKKLEMVASMMTYYSPNGLRYTVGDCYFDYRAGLMWTTILGESQLKAWPTYQALYPAQQDEFMEAETIQEIWDLVLKFLRTKNGCTK